MNKNGWVVPVVIAVMSAWLVAWGITVLVSPTPSPTFWASGGSLPTGGYMLNVVQEPVDDLTGYSCWISHNGYKCFDSQSYGSEVEPIDWVTVQRLEEPINDGYYIFVIHSECNGTSVVAFDPSRETCKTFVEPNIFVDGD